MAPPVYLVDLTVYDPAIGSERVLRYGTAGFVTEPSDTPSNAYYAPRVRQPARLARSLFREGSTFGRAQESFGELLLLNGDGALDDLRGYAFDGREMVVRQGVAGAALTSFTTVLIATMERAHVTSDVVRVTVRDRALELAVPFQATKYAGDNDLPDGLEGVAGDLKGKPKPRCVGVVKNVPAPCVNTSKLIYQVNDGPVADVDAVYDRGIPLINTIFEAQTSGFGATNINTACSSGPLYVVGGDAGTLATSPDGETWTLRTSGFGASAILGSCYGNGLFVIGGAAGNLATSPDGVTWTGRTSGFGADSIVGLCYAEGLGLYVAVGSSGKISTSPDGVTWTAQTSGTAETLLAVRYGFRRLVTTGSTNTTLISDDGVTWSAPTQGIAGVGQEVVYDVRHGFVAVLDSAAAAFSDDGDTWTTITAPVSGSFRGVAVAYGLFIGVINTGQVAFSVDRGRTWALADASFAASTALTMVAWGDAGFVAVGASGLLGFAPGRRPDYADEAELLDDTLAPVPGQIGVYPVGGYVRLGSPPAGLITADVTEGATAADRTAGQVFARILADPLGGSLVPFSDDDIAALDTAIDAEVGFWTDQELTLAAVADLVARSAGAWWSARNDGTLRIVQFTAPSGSPVLSLTESQVFGLARAQPNDAGRGIPCYRTILRYARHYVTQDTDLAGGVTDARRAELAAEWREAKAEDLTVPLAHPLAPEIVEESLLADAAEAAAEATRRQALRGTERDVFTCAVALDEDSAALELGDVVQLTHSRFGLSAGVSMRVLGLEPDPAQRRLALTLWT